MLQNLQGLNAKVFNDFFGNGRPYALDSTGGQIAQYILFGSLDPGLEGADKKGIPILGVRYHIPIQHDLKIIALRQALSLSGNLAGVFLTGEGLVPNDAKFRLHLHTGFGPKGLQIFTCQPHFATSKSIVCACCSRTTAS